jgi:hypothetical protein
MQLKATQTLQIIDEKKNTKMIFQVSVFTLYAFTEIEKR